MLKQIFHKNIPIQILFDLFEDICLKNDKFYTFDINAYRIMLFRNLHEPFFNTIIDFYHKSKKFYVTRKLNYNSFINIIRQICKSNDVPYISQIKYNNSNYNIDYFIYFQQNEQVEK
jgi:hypothetical protein